MDQGETAVVLAGQGPTAVALRCPPCGRPRVRRPHSIRIRGACARNLRDVDVALPGSGFVAVTGVSGSGKTSLVFDVIEASARAGRAVECREVEGLDRFVEVRACGGAGAGATPLSALGLMPALQRLYSAAAAGTGLAKQSFSYASPAGRCETCRGTGRQEVAMDLLADVVVPCPACGGARYRPEVLAVKWHDTDVAQFLALDAATLRPMLPAGELRSGLDALVRVRLGHVALGRRRAELSGGEAQRLTLAASLLGAPTPCLYLLDEPATGLHEGDLENLLKVIDALVARGDLVVAAEHRTSLVAAADWVVDLGPGGGGSGGRLVGAGQPAELRPLPVATQDKV